jgi:cobalt/nickel transport system permease protein
LFRNSRNQENPSMHMADALLSPAVGGTMFVGAAGVLAWCCRRVGRELDDRAVPLMGVLGAFVFAAQMINFTIPGTGSSGHLGGGLLLAVILGPARAFLTMSSIVVVQALLFADGGLLALGCNLFNLGFLPCFIGYPIFRRLAGETPSRRRLSLAVVCSAITAVPAGALAVVVQTVLSGISELPFRAFVSVMVPIHLAIGLVEGVATAALADFLRQEKPELWAAATDRIRGGSGGMLAALATAAILTAGVFSWHASELPDGLEWSILKVAGTVDLPSPADGVHARLATLQDGSAVLSDYRLAPGRRTARYQLCLGQRHAESGQPDPSLQPVGFRKLEDVEDGRFRAGGEVDGSHGADLPVVGLAGTAMGEVASRETADISVAAFRDVIQLVDDGVELLFRGEAQEAREKNLDKIEDLPPPVHHRGEAVGFQKSPAAAGDFWLAGGKAQGGDAGVDAVRPGGTGAGDREEEPLGIDVSELRYPPAKVGTQVGEVGREVPGWRFRHQRVSASLWQKRQRIGPAPGLTGWPAGKGIFTPSWQSAHRASTSIFFLPS